MIGAEQLAAAFESGAVATEEDLEQWFETNEVDPDALAEMAIGYARAVPQRRDRAHVHFVVGFRMGVEAMKQKEPPPPKR